MKKVTNIWKHFIVAFVIVGIVCLVNWLINMIPNTVADFRWFGFFVLAIYCFKFEIMQENQSTLQTIEYLKRKWLDIVCDIVAGLSGGIVALGLFNILLRA